MNRRQFSFLGQHPYWTRCCIGPSSSKSQQTEQQNQVGVEGTGAIGVGSTTGSNNRQTINVQSEDPEVLEAGLATVQNVSDTAVNAVVTSQNIAAGEVTDIGDTYAQNAELQTEQTNAALDAALQIAANAAPQTQAAQDEIQSGTGPLSTDGTTVSTSMVLILIAAVGLIYTLTKGK